MAGDAGEARPGRAGARVPQLAVAWAPAVVAFVAVRLFLLAAAAAHGLGGADARTWARWDSYQYLSIAMDGYTWGVSDGRNSPYPPGMPTGNAGWLPGYPMLMRIGPRVGLTPLTAGFWWSAGFGLLMLRAVDALVPPEVPFGRRLAVVLLTAFFPGFVYAHAVFPVSLAVLLLATSVRLTAGGRWTSGGLVGAAAAFTYTSGYLIAPVMGAWAILSNRTGRGGIVRRAADRVGPSLLPIAGLVAAMAMQRVQIGRWDGLFRVQAAHGLRLGNPFATLGRYLKFVTSVDRAQVPVVAALVAAVVAVTAARWRRRSAADQLLAVAATAYWIAPLSLGAGVSPWRAMAVLAAFVPPLARRLPTAVLWAVVVTFAVLGWAMCGRFLDGTAV